MDNIYNNIPAFPLSFDVDENKPNSCVQMGMSLKDYYAGQALVGFLSNGTSMDNAAHWSWLVAEKMMKKRQENLNKIQ